MPIHGYPGNVITANPTTPTVSSASGVWTTEQQLINQSAGRWPMAATQISRSLRFNSADSAYLNRTPASAGSTTLGTLSNWIKLGVISTDRMTYHVAGTSGNNNRFYITFNADNTFQIVGYNSSASIVLNLNTTQLFRDPSAWYHIVVAIDTTQATSSNRAKLYINGTQVTAFSTATYPSQNQALGFTNNTSTLIGSNQGVGNLFNGYITEVNFIDGQALDPSYFGFNNSDTGVWTPRQYTGAYGTNGFYLNFSDNSNTTAATLGKDYSGNGNNWTPNNFSVTAGAGNDSLVDSPTSYGTDTGVGGEVRGNYATLNPLDKNSGITLSDGNLNASMPTQVENVYGTVSVTSGKWYWETTINSMSGRLVIGVGNAVDQSWNLDPASSSSLWGYYSVNGNKLNAGSVAYGNSFTTNDVIGVAVDMDSGKIWFSKNNTWQASGDPAAGTNAAFTNLSGSVRPMYDQQLTNAVTFSCNFGQRAFAYTAPSGFKALCTQNLPTPTIKQGDDYFNAVLYTGNGTAISNNTVGFQPDWTWIKGRSGATNHQHFDSIRGVTNVLVSNSAEAETTSANTLTSFDSSGFTVGSNTALNTSTATYVAWNWNAASSNTTDNSGTITSTRRTNTTAGFSVVTWTASGVNPTIGHGLGAAPSMIIAKSRTGAGYGWAVYHASLGRSKFLSLDATTAETSYTNYWGTADPTSTVFGTSDGAYNNNFGNMVAYVFAAVDGYSAFGSYTGNGSTDGVFVYLGFRPRFILIKATSAVEPWAMLDSVRDPYNLNDAQLTANSSAAETNDGNGVDFVSNGVKLRSSIGNWNSNGATYIYAAFAENPFKYSLAR